MKGAYLLILELPADMTLHIGKKGVVSLKKGSYGYVGSALNGLEQRIGRHLRTQKKPHWHIDYLLDHARITQVLVKESTRREECILAYAFKEGFHEIPGFGCSDCACRTHLFFGPADAMTQRATSLQMKPYPLDANS